MAETIFGQNIGKGLDTCERCSQFMCNGAEEEVHGVTDLHTGQALEWEVVDGTHARANGHPRANPESHFIKVTLARPVPEGGQGRIRIDKTYWDAESYFLDGDDILFDRSLGIRRNAVVLPSGYELVGANYPVQVETEDDGRILLSFMNSSGCVLPVDSCRGNNAGRPVQRETRQ